jgi:hypothetical protein
MVHRSDTRFDQIFGDCNEVLVSLVSFIFQSCLVPIRSHLSTSSAKQHNKKEEDREKNYDIIFEYNLRVVT